MIPKIAIIIPCFNQGDYLAEALDSVIVQSLKDWECIIVDDGSTDNSAEIAKLYAQKDKRISYIHQDNAGPSAARNKGVEQTTAPLLFFLDADNMILSNFLKRGVDYMNLHPNTVLYNAKAEYFGMQKGEFKLHYSSYKDLLVSNSIDCACVVHRTDFNRIGGFDEQLRGYEDWEFFIRLLYHQDRIYTEPTLLFRYRVSNGTTSVNSQAKAKHDEKTMYIYKKHLDKYEEFFGTPFFVTAEYNRLVKELGGILNSKAYRLGKAILFPLRKIKNLFKS